MSFVHFRATFVLRPAAVITPLLEAIRVRQLRLGPRIVNRAKAKLHYGTGHSRRGSPPTVHRWKAQPGRGRKKPTKAQPFSPLRETIGFDLTRERVLIAGPEIKPGASSGVLRQIEERNPFMVPAFEEEQRIPEFWANALSN